ncbi:MAG: bifunctional glutamate N-acetyltransferase/amino-acid acetyltransferase ArgJ [Paracoccaceae bacterium]
MKTRAELEQELAALRQEAARLRADAAGSPAPRISPLAPPRFPDLPVIAGVRFAAAEAAVKYRGRRDVMLAAIDEGSTIAGVFTRSATRAEPVLWCQRNLARLHSAGPKRGGFGILVNSGNANAFTGAAGIEAVRKTASAAAEALDCSPEHVFVASTGVIGEPLPAERVVAKIGELVDGLSPSAAREAAEAIMTTDTFPKGARAEVDLGGRKVRIAGFAKGSGMIEPDMATMLVFIFTDAAIEAPVLQDMLARGTGTSFNCITVDSDTSTSDTLILAATGRSGIAPIRSTEDGRSALFMDGLSAVMTDLAHQVVRDGEGATKFVTVNVTGAESERSARVIGKAIANSPLVKTAIAGEDPNWGRVVMAVGKSGEPADRDRMSIRFGGVTVAENGRVASGYREELGAAVMKAQEIEITVDLGVGDGTATVWTCDLTHGYITINADYRS